MNDPFIWMLKINTNPNISLIYLLTQPIIINIKLIDIVKLW